MVPSLRHIPPGAGEAAGGELGHPHVQGGHRHHARAVLQILVQVNTDENPELKAMFSVTTYPRVLLFTAGSRYEPLKYEKSWGLSFEPVNSWLKQQLD